MDDPLITGVVVFGAGKPLNGVLVRKDPSAQKLSSEEFIDAIWPTVERVNTIVPNHSRLIRQMVIVADTLNKPFLETDKNSIRTADTLDLYKEEIAAAYNALEAEAETEAVKDVNTPEEIVEYVRDVVSKVARRPLGDDDDFFENGAPFHSLFSFNTLNTAFRSGLPPRCSDTYRNYTSLYQIL